jgi:hypothetical protein
LKRICSTATTRRGDEQSQVAEVLGEDLSFQSFLQHATLFLPRFNTEFVSTDKVGERRFSPFRMAERHQGTGQLAFWRAKFRPNYTAKWPMQMNRADVPTRRPDPRKRVVRGWAGG